MVCCYGKEDPEWQQEYMKQFKVTRKNAKKKRLGWCERAGWPTFLVGRFAGLLIFWIC